MHPVHEMVIWGLLALLVRYLSPPEVPEHGLLPKVFGLLRRHTRVPHDWRSFTVGFAWGFGARKCSWECSGIWSGYAVRYTP